MKDKLRELAEWMRGINGHCADALTEILDAEGDGGTAYDVGWKIRGVTAYNAAKAKGLRHPECVEAAIKAAPRRFAGVVSDEDVRDAERYREFCKQASEAAFPISLLEDAFEMGSGVLNLHFDGAKGERHER